MTKANVVSKYLSIFVFLLAVNLFDSGPVNAHIMVAQHGTLNIVGNSVYTVISVPLSAFYKIEHHHEHAAKDTDEMMIEFNTKKQKITELVKKHISLHFSQTSVSLDGLRVIPSLNHDGTNQVIIMGRFDIKAAEAGFEFRLNLFGQEPSEQSYKMTAKHKMTGWQQTFVIDKDKPHVSVIKM